jgi:phenylpropionate dioxygenase-like ring-hydroxylating dioxygenase large terminal subunit
VLVDQTAAVFRRCWHPIARSDEVNETGTAGTPLVVMLLGDRWRVERTGSSIHARTVDHPHGEQPAALVERFGLVWIAPESPVTPLVEVPEAGDPAFIAGWLEPTTAPVSAAALIDNFCDVAHFPFVHAGTFGDAESPVVGDLRPVVDGWLAHVDHEQTFANHDDTGVGRGERPLHQRRRARYTYVTPFTAKLRLDHLDSGGTTVILFTVQPIAARSCRIYTVLYRDGIDDDQMADTVAFEERVLAEDLTIQTRLPAAFDLDPTAELHTAADRLTLTIRRMLASFIESGGAS